MSSTIAVRTSVRPSSTSTILRRDRQLDAFARAERERRVRVCTPSATIFMLPRISLQRTPPGQLDADMPVAAERAGAREDEVAEARSDPRASLAARPAAVASRPISVKPRVMSAASALCRSRARRRRPAAIAMMFFIAPPISTPTTSSLRVEAEIRRAEFRLHAGRRVAGRSMRRSTAVGSCRANSAAKLGPDSTTTGCARSSYQVEQLGHPQQRLGLESLRRGHDDGAGGDERRGGRHHRADAVRRHRADRRARACSSARSSDAVASTPAGNAMSGRYVGVGSTARVISAASAGSRAHSRTGWPSRARCTASAVPKLPAPSTARAHHDTR